jgi:hypothetical protein
MRPSHLYWVTLTSQDRDGGTRLFRLVFECEFESVARLGEELREFGVVSGYRLRVGNDGAGNRVLRERAAFMFGAAAVISVQAYLHEIAEAGL